MMDRYVNKKLLPTTEEKHLDISDLLFFLNPCAACIRNQFRENCLETCRWIELWNKLIENIKYDTRFTVEEIDFLLMSEEERVNTYKNCDEIWKSCVSKLERQKEMLNNESN